MQTRPSLKDVGLGTGKKARLHRILHEHGVRNGTAIFLPYDHGLEHGPRDSASRSLLLRTPGLRQCQPGCYRG